MSDLVRVAHRLNTLRDERQSIAVRLLNGTTTLSSGQVHELKRRYSWVAGQIQRLERRLT